MIVSLLVSIISLNTCVNKTQITNGINIDLKEIRERGKLIAITNTNSIDYFVFQGHPMGFQYELLQKFAEYSGLQLELIASNNVDEITRTLLEGKCDIIAIGMPVTSELNPLVAFTNPIMQSKQVLVQRKPDNWRTLPPKELAKLLIHSPLELAGKTVVVQRGTAYAQRLKNISAEIGAKIEIVEVPQDQEQLVQFVAGGELNYTVCDEQIANVNQASFPQLDVSTEVSFPQNLSWGIRKNSEKLQEEINKWFTKFKGEDQFAILYSKYYKNRWFPQMVSNDYYLLNSGRISPYDDEIKKYSTELKWDWRLLAAVICQESNFNPKVRSYAGAYGLMQVTPSTAHFFGFDSVTSPTQNIKVGVKLIKWLDKRFARYVKNPNERIKFVLASYNIGVGHVIDAMLLAKKYKKDMSKWDNVKVFLLKKSQKKYYTDPLAKHGYCVGIQTVNYVSEILTRFRHYKNITSMLNT